MSDDLVKSAMVNLGGHLLGRKPMPHDARDYQLEDYLAARGRMAAAYEPGMTLQQVADAHDLQVWHDVYAFWHWFKSEFLNPIPAPTPSPVPSGPVSWADTDQVLDQGQTGHCVGFCGAQWGNTLPVDDHYTDADGHSIYYDCKIVDGEPRAEDGSNSRSLCKVLTNRKRIGAYAFTTNAQTVATYVSQHGPIGTGTDWYNAMFRPDADNYLNPTGGVDGGHEWLIVGYSSTGYGAVKVPSLMMQNSWGASWAQSGRAYLRISDYQKLLTGSQDTGDAWAGLELPA